MTLSHTGFAGRVCSVVLCSAMVLSSPASAQPLAQGQRKFVGNVVSSGFSIRSDFQNYWNQVTAENAGKWGSVEGSPGSYNWTELDNIYNYAINHSFRYKHHNLIWGQQQPSFMNTLDSTQQYQEIVNWIMMSGQRYPSAAFCDVVNEPLHAPPAYKNALGGDGATGWDWVIRAFQLARQYWPFVKLHVNDYGILNDGGATALYLQVINALHSRGLVDGIGVQCHRFEIEAANPTNLRNNLNSLAATGLPIYITELDLGNPGNTGTPNDSLQLALYQAKFPILWEHPGVQGFTLWGYVQGQTWQSTCYLVRTNGTERSALQWLRTYLQTPLPPSVVSPSGTTGEPRNPVLVWSSSVLATSYRVQIATNSSFATIVADSVVADTVLHAAPLAASTMFYWRVSASNTTGTSSYSAPASFTTGTEIVAVNEPEEMASAYRLAQNYPNPFNPATTIEFSVPVRTTVRLGIVDVLGQSVMDLAHGTFEAGTSRVRLDASALPSGVYFCRMEAGPVVRSIKLVVMR